MVTLKYKASSGHVYDLQTNKSILTKEANYHAWEWEAIGTELQYGMRVSAFSKDPAEYKTELVFNGPLAVRKAMIENLHEDFELDIRNNTPGRIIWGDYYIDCFITESSTGPDESWTVNEINIFCPYPFWIEETTRSFMPQSAPGAQSFLDYDYDYNYDYYYGSPGIANWQTGFPFPAEFKMVVYGPATDPSVTVNGYAYSFTDTLDATDYVVIDSRSNTIIKYLANGTTSSLFDARNKTQSIFEPMPAGTLTFNWSGTFGFDLTLYKERSEPRWNT